MYSSAVTVGITNLGSNVYAVHATAASGKLYRIHTTYMDYPTQSYISFANLGNTTISGTVVEPTQSYRLSGNLYLLNNSDINGDAATFTGITDSGLTSTRVPFATTGGLLTDDSNLFYNSTTKILTTGGLTLQNNKYLDFLTAAGTSDGTRLYKTTADGLGFDYAGNTFIYKATDDKPINYRTSTGRTYAAFTPLTGRVCINCGNGSTTLDDFTASLTANITGATTIGGTTTLNGTTVFNDNISLANGKKFTMGTYVVSCAFGFNSSTFTCYTAVDGEVVTDAYAEIVQAWDGTGLFTVGDAGDNDGFLTDAGITQGTLGYYGYQPDKRGVYLSQLDEDDYTFIRKIYTASTNIVVYTTAGTSTTGIANVFLVIQKLK
jgi:hypothetical protein